MQETVQEREGEASPDLVVVLGPTASGKTRLAVTLARALQSDVISADSRQLYREMDLGTGKDLDEYGDVSVHLLDLVDPMTEFNVFEYQKQFYDVYARCRLADQIPVLCGGSGLYLDAVLSHYQFGRERPRSGSDESHPSDNSAPSLTTADPASITETSDHPLLIPQNPLIFGIYWPRSVLRKRITARLKERIEQGMIEEVERLVERGVTYERLEAFGLEYRWIALYLQKKMRYNDFFQRLNSAIHQFAKRQETWFRKMERSGVNIEWFLGGEQLEEQALRRLQSCFPDKIETNLKK